MNTQKRTQLREQLAHVIQLIRGAALTQALEETEGIASASEDDPEILGKAYSRWGEIYGMLGELDLAIENYSRADSLLRELDNSIGTRARAQRNLAATYLVNGLPDTALSTIKLAHAIGATIAEPGVKRRAQLEFHIVAGQVQAALNLPGRITRHYSEALALLTEEAAHMNPDGRMPRGRAPHAKRFPNVDVLLVGGVELIGGLALAHSQGKRDEGVALLESAAERFAGGRGKERLPYHEARAYDHIGRALLDPKSVRKARSIYESIGAARLTELADAWLDSHPRAQRIVPLKGTGPILGGMVAIDKSARDLLANAVLVARSDAAVALHGETGTGKDMLARFIHDNSPRAAGEFVPVDCGEFPETLLESELFGYERGAFTGAATKKEGRIVKAHKGTLFLDEIGELTPPVQAKLLRVLQTKTVQPIGATKRIPVDFRLITATNRNLEAMLLAKDFRRDLYYRIQVAKLETIPLRDRPSDIPALAEFFLRKLEKEKNVGPYELATSALRVLVDHQWHGNVRELENVISAAVIYADANNLIDAPVIEQILARNRVPGDMTGVVFPTLFPNRDYVGDLARWFLSNDPDAQIDWAEIERGVRLTVFAEALRRTGYIQKSAARLLNLPISNVHYHINEIDKDAERLGVESPTLRRKRGSPLAP